MKRFTSFLAVTIFLVGTSAASAQCCVQTTAYYQPQTVYYAAAPAQTVYYAPAVPVTTTYYAPATTVYYAPAPTTVYSAPAPVVTNYYRPLVGAGITRVGYYTPAVTYAPANTVYYRAW